MYEHEIPVPLNLEAIEDLFDLPASHFEENNEVYFFNNRQHANSDEYSNPSHGPSPTSNRNDQHSAENSHHDNSAEATPLHRSARDMEHSQQPGINPTDLFHSPVVGALTADGTPLLSPTMVSDSRHFSGEFSIPPSYFSSLISPSLGPSEGPAGQPASANSRNTRQRRSVGSARVVKQSPQTRPRRRRATPSSGSSTANNSLTSVNGTSAPNSSGSNGSVNYEGSTPQPSSEGVSPTSGSYSASASSTTSPIKDEEPEMAMHLPPPAATPARLMNLAANSDARRANGEKPHEQHVEERLNMALLATQAVPVRHGSTSSLNSPSSTPGMPANPGLTPGLTPRMSASSGDRRFSTASNTSVSSAITPAIRPRLMRQGSRVSSATTSPAIAPAIGSPNMSPRGAPEGDVAALLASKSNYQNLLEGNHHQLGLQYPERLTSDLTTKKASHKIAEQERRNRINSAIVELGRLIVPDVPMSSKAATVEAAITYIRDMQSRVQDLEKQLAER